MMEKAKTGKTSLQKRSRKITAVAVVVSMILLAGGSLIHVLLQDILESTTDSRIRMAAAEYKSNLLRLVENDIQILQTLESFWEERDIVDEEELAGKLREVTEKNDFPGMAYFGKDVGILIAAGKENETGVSYETLPEPMQEALARAGEGETAISDIYDSENMGREIFVVCVPVTVDGELRGVLAAADLASRVGELFSEQFIPNGYSYVHLIGNDGMFRVRSRESSIPEDMEDIFSSPNLTDRVKESIRAVMEEEESGMFMFRRGNTRYKLFLEPVGLNGWYLLCVNPLKEVVGSIYWIITGTQAVFILILAFCLLVIVSGFRLLRNNNRQLIQAAYVDPLTESCNLPGFTKKMEEACGRNEEFSVAVLNIYQFKFINEIFGRQQADQLLRYIGGLLGKELAPEEFYGRATGDFFYLFLMSTDRREIEERIHKIMRRIKDAPFLQRSSYHVLFYCGVTGTQGQERNGDLSSRMMTQVMFALDKAGETHQDNVWFYDIQLHEKEKRENYIESHMHQALENGEFRLYLQPKINLKDGSLAGAEALVRWITDEGKMMFPNDFIPLFEKNGFCTRLDMYMMECACRHIHHWMECGIRPVPISVNHSRLLFYEEEYPERLKELVDRYEIPAGLITLEILEGLAIGNVEEMNERISLLHKAGFRISMDDFGAGYSSLNVMGALKIDELKLDRAFLMEVSQGNNLRQKAVMEMVIALTRRLRIATVAEGVETKEDEALIRELGCDAGQGYYYSRPVSAEEFDGRFIGAGL